jgi:hypothetical protein
MALGSVCQVSNGVPECWDIHFFLSIDFWEGRSAAWTSISTNTDVTDIESDKAPRGLSEDTVRFISARKDEHEPEWMLAWRLDAYRHWLTIGEPHWARVEYGPIDYQSFYHYAAPKKRTGPKSLEEIDPEILRTYEHGRQPIFDDVADRDDADERPSSTTGTCRNLPAVIHFMISLTVIASVQVTMLHVITWSRRPSSAAAPRSASARTMSRSDRMPATPPAESVTTKAPIRAQRAP